jgi:hypothetical protein
MTKRLFVCHANADIESTSEIVDVLENTLEFVPGTLQTSSLPGYSSDARNEDELRAILAETSIVLALVTKTSMEDPEFNFELGAVWALGLRTVSVVMDGTGGVRLPWPARELPSVSAQDKEEWATLMGDLSLRLGLVVRNTLPQSPALSPLEFERDEPSAFELPAQPMAAAEAAPERAALSYAAGAPDDDWAADAPREETPQPRAADASEPELALSVAANDSEASDAGYAPAAALLQDVEDSAALSLSLTPSEPPASSAVFARLPSCEMALEAGRAVSDCLFNRAEISDFAAELGGPLGRLVDAIGGSWESLRSSYDFDGWISMTDYLLNDLPEQAHHVQDWYQLGFELAILHNLAGQLELAGPQRSEAGELQWRAALERFLTRAEAAQIGYEKLGRVLALLENLAGPRSDRELANIGRSLAELRSYAAGADGIHTAA